MDRLGIEFITVFGMPPVALVNLAADLGCKYITTALQPTDYNPHGYPKYALKTDLAQRRELIAVMRDHGVSLSLGEGCALLPGVDVRSAYPRDLDIMRELGITRINTVCFEPDQKRGFDQLGALTEMAAAVGIETMIEFVPTFGIADLATALAAVRHVGRRELRLNIDTMHFARSGARPADIAAVDPAVIGYIQLCDAPRVAKIASYLEEAMYQRMVPGEGELPLFDILAALPRDCIVGLEVPLRAEAEVGVSTEARVRRCVEAGRRLLGRLGKH